MMPFDEQSASALALAQSALHTAQDAKRVASDARGASRAIYETLADISTRLARLEGGQQELTALVGRGLGLRSDLPPMREREKSVHDIAQEAAESAAKRVVEETGSHLVMPSVRVREIVAGERQKVIANAALKIVVIVVTALVAAIVGHAVK